MIPPQDVWPPAHTSVSITLFEHKSMHVWREQHYLWCQPHHLASGSATAATTNVADHQFLRDTGPASLLFYKPTLGHKTIKRSVRASIEKHRSHKNTWKRERTGAFKHPLK